MGQTKTRKAGAQIGNQTGTSGGQNGGFSLTPPTVNTGRGAETTKGGQVDPSGAERFRINTTLPEGIFESLKVIAGVTGKTLSQVALAAIEDGLPAQGQKARNVMQMRRGGE